MDPRAIQPSVLVHFVVFFGGVDNFVFVMTGPLVTTGPSAMTYRERDDMERSDEESFMLHFDEDTTARTKRTESAMILVNDALLQYSNLSLPFSHRVYIPLSKENSEGRGLSATDG